MQTGTSTRGKKRVQGHQLLRSQGDVNDTPKAKTLDCVSASESATELEEYLQRTLFLAFKYFS